MEGIKMENKVLSIVGNNKDGVDIIGIVNGRKFGQWYESLQDFNDYFDTRLDLANWKESVQQAKEIIAENMQCFDCDEEQYLID